MPLDLSRLRAPIAPSGKPDLDAGDERFVAIDSLASKERWADAAVKVAELLAEDVYDIRPIPYYLFAAFLDDGFRALAGVFEAVDNLAGPSFEAVAPSKRREDYFNKRLAWLFEKIANSIEYHEKFKTEQWALWQATVTLDALEQALAAGTRASERLSSALYTQAGLALGQLIARLRGQAEVARAASPSPAQPAASPSPSPSAASPSASSAPATDSGAPAKSTTDAASTPSSSTPAAPAKSHADPLENDGRERMELVVSASFLDLCRRLKAFETLVAGKKFEKAAVLGDEIAKALQDFDPRTHFPQLFGKYVALQARHVHALAEHEGERQSPAFRALQQYCRVDLEGFVENDP